jgi:hypothetical protein
MSHAFGLLSPAVAISITRESRVNYDLDHPALIFSSVTMRTGIHIF